MKLGDPRPENISQAYRDAQLIVHQCCGCTCHVCAVFHQSGNHTQECWDHFMKELKEDGPGSKQLVASYQVRKEASVGDE